MAVIITLGACFAISSDAIVERSKADIAARLSFLLYTFLIWFLNFKGSQTKVTLMWKPFSDTLKRTVIQ